MALDKNWIDKTDDKELEDLFGSSHLLEKLSSEKYKEILTKIKKNDYYNKKPGVFVSLFHMFSFARPVVRYSFSFAMIVVIIFSTVVFITKYRSLNFIGAQNYCYVTSIIGEVYEYQDDINNKRKLEIGDNITEHSIIKTMSGSIIEITIGKDSFVKIKENSELHLLQLFNQKDIEITQLMLSIGEITAKPDKVGDGSSFEIETSSIVIGVRGTEFLVSVNELNDTNVFVREGIISIKPKWDLQELQNIQDMNAEVAQEIRHILLEDTFVAEGEGIEVVYSSFKEEKRIVSTIISELHSDINNTKSIETIRDKINDKIKTLKNARKKIMTKKSGIIFQKKDETEKKASNNKFIQNNEINEEVNEKEKIFKIVKIPSKTDISLSEKRSSVTSDGKLLYIANDIDKSVYCIDPFTGELIWQYQHTVLNKITTPLSHHKGKLIITNPTHMFILKSNGETESIKEVDKGAEYWASSVNTDELLFIPSAEGVYTYNGEAFDFIRPDIQPRGQLYINVNYNTLYISYSNHKMIQTYDLLTNEKIWQSDQLDNRIFMSPYIQGKYIYTGDSVSKIYRFDSSSQKSKPKSVTVETGMISDLVGKNNVLYFIGTDGWLYSLSTITFSKAKRIIQVDYKPNSDKYLIKNIMITDNDLYFCSDTGNLLYYNIKGRNPLLFDIVENEKKLPLIGSPIKINNDLYVIDTQCTIYRLTKNNK